jgi:cell division protein FtsQ
VLVTEREPIAIWQSEGRYQLVDADGLAAGDNIDDYPGLPLVVGAGAPEHVSGLLAMLAAEKDLMGRVKASQWVSGQRWNIVMTGPAGDIEVRLPEEDPASAWHDLARIEADHKLLERKLDVVDMRLPDRLVLRVPGGIEQPDKSLSTPPGRHKAPGRDA